MTCKQTTPIEKESDGKGFVTELMSSREKIGYDIRVGVKTRPSSISY